MGGCQRGQQQGHAVVALVARQPDRAPQRRRAHRKKTRSAMPASRKAGRPGNQVARARQPYQAQRGQRVAASGLRPVQLAPAVSRKAHGDGGDEAPASRARARPARSIRRAAAAGAWTRAAPRSRPRHCRQRYSGRKPISVKARIAGGAGRGLGRVRRWKAGCSWWTCAVRLLCMEPAGPAFKVYLKCILMPARKPCQRVDLIWAQTWLPGGVTSHIGAAGWSAGEWRARRVSLV